jgi:hypothetical protein
VKLAAMDRRSRHALLGALSFLGAVETVLVHWALIDRVAWLAWTLTISSLTTIPIVARAWRAP